MKKKITYYLFGEVACRIYTNEGADAVIERYENDEYYGDWETFEFIEGETQSIDLMYAFNGYMDYAIITKEEYEKL